jgi:hypothetical protein
MMHVVVPADSDWCGLPSVQAVCRLYNVDVTDFSTSFADGRVLCLLVCSGLKADRLHVPERVCDVGSVILRYR